MADQTQRLEIATVRTEVGSNIVFRFTNDAANADSIPTQSGNIKNLKQVVLEIQQEAAEKISISTTIYPTVSAGLAATADQGIFLVQSNDADEIYTVWQNQAGTAVNTGKTALSASAIEAALEASNEAARAAEEAADVATSRTARYLTPSGIQPTVRDNGLPLEIGDVWFDTVQQTEYRYTEQGWRPNESIAAINQLEEELGSAQGASKIGSRIDADGGVYRSQKDINADRITANDFGLIGDGSDETSKIIAFFAAKAGAGKAYLQRDKVYGFTGTLTFPQGLDLITNGSTFRRLQTAGSYGLVVSDDVKIDRLRLSTPGGPAEGGTNVIGSNIDILSYKFISDTIDCGYGSPRNALLVQAGTGQKIGKMYIRNHSKPTSFQLVDQGDIGRLTASGYVTGCYCINVTNTVFKGALFTGVSPSAVGGPGQNALLVEATKDYGTRNLTFEDWTAEDSP